MSDSWIQTRSGIRFFPLAPVEADIRIEDIAHALGNLCRFGGHSRRFMSVAEHCVRVAGRIFDATEDSRLALWGLLHDASEAYLVDIPKPLKVQPEFAPYREAEARLQAAICRRFGLEGKEPAVVKFADLELLASEAYHLMSPVHPEWAKNLGRALPPPLPGIFPGWGPEESTEFFLARFYAFGGRP